MKFKTTIQAPAGYNILLVLITLITGGILFASCSADTEGTDNFEEKHVAELENMALSAGTSTIFLDSSK
jgi:hypothetical protein